MKKLLVFLLAAMMAFSALPAMAETAEYKDTLIVGTYGDQDTLDPQVNVSNDKVLRLLYDGLLTHDNDQAVLTLLQTKDLIRDKYPRVQIDATLRDVVGIISDSEAAVLAVIDSNGRFQGMVDVAAARKYLFSPDKYDSIHVYNIMETPPDYIYYGEKMDTVMRKFEKTGAWRLPVVDPDSKKYLGFISKSRLLMAYRAELREISLED